MAYSLRDFGSYTVGGHVHHVTTGEPREVQFTRSASYTYDPRGQFCVGQTYVQYFIPEARRDAPPIVLVHGGGMHGSTWETTPDGRPGWLHLLLDRGYEVHVVDLVERGRAGFAAGIWPDAPILRSGEEAWTLFRFGSLDRFESRQAFDKQQFPVAHFDAFLARMVPRWLSNTALQTAGLIAVLDRLKQAVVICHSQGGEITFDAMAQRPGAVAGVLAVEPSGLPEGTLDFALSILGGDYLDSAEHWTERAKKWAATAEAIARKGGVARYIDTAAEIAPGGSHMLMMDAHNAACLEAGLAGLNLPT
ncbi:alpha/beta fold hydrolase [Roseovarius sp. 2305UL8-3]|uniref:alpha/beta fold hydrolase n=1 Tax=Roseovarius conchicola TaxID=3121636 RepID=UPI0035282166